MWPIRQSAVGRVVVAPAAGDGQVVFYTTRDFSGRIDDEIAKTLSDVVRHLSGVDAMLSTCTQVHGTTAQPAGRTKSWRERRACDALWSDERGVALGIKVADCLPVSIIDPAHGVIANIHSGWRGAAQRITASTVNDLLHGTAFAAASAHAYLGPSIRVCCFEVGEEVVEQFAAAYPHAEGFVDRSRTKPHVDIPALTAAVLSECGFPSENIHDSELCTRCPDSLFHSYRREGKGGGRNLAIVAQ